MKTPDRFSARVQQAFAAARLPRSLAVRSATSTTPAEILLYDEVGPYGVTAKDFSAALASAGAGPVKIRINSPGGDVFDAMAIYNALRARTGGVTIQVDGLAASAASFIALAGSRMEMAQNAMLMIHCAWAVAAGNTNDMTAMAGVLTKIDNQIVGMYVAKTGANRSSIIAAMDAETWYTAAEAKAAGYCDAITTPPKSAKAAGAASAAAKRRFDLRARIALADGI
jgi:ATP-dependent protease ClpP protease subunit